MVPASNLNQAPLKAMLQSRSLKSTNRFFSAVSGSTKSVGTSLDMLVPKLGAIQAVGRGGTVADVPPDFLLLN